MLTISTIPEALAELEKLTGRAWTDSELFDMAANYGINLHAAPPITAESAVYEFVEGEGIRVKCRLPPGHATLAVIFPWQVAQLWVSGETRTVHRSDHDRFKDEFLWFTKPVKVTREQVRIKGDALEAIVARWRHAQERNESDSSGTGEGQDKHWKPKKPKGTFRGYGRPLYALLLEASRAGKAIPTASDVLATWKENTPPEVTKVMVNSIEYWSANGVVKEAGLDAIRKAIGRMTTG
jgi:hypothetical protein